MTIVANEEVVTDNLVYGDWTLIVKPVEFSGVAFYFTDDPSNPVLAEEESADEHRVNNLSIVTGKYPGEVGQNIFMDFNWHYSGNVTIDDGGKVNIGDVVGGEILASTHRTAYTLNLESDMVIDIFALGVGPRTPDSLVGDTFDPMLYIYDDEGNLLFWNDEGTGLSMHKGGEDWVFDAALEVVSLKAGTYSIQVGGFSDLIGGPYAFIVRQTPGT